MAATNTSPQESPALDFDPSLLGRAPPGRRRYAIHETFPREGHEGKGAELNKVLRFGLLAKYPKRNVAVIEAPASAIVYHDGYTIRLIDELLGAGKRDVLNRDLTPGLTMLSVPDALGYAKKRALNLELIWAKPPDQSWCGPGWFWPEHGRAGGSDTVVPLSDPAAGESGPCGSSATRESRKTLRTPPAAFRRHLCHLGRAHPGRSPWPRSWPR